MWQIRLNMAKSNETIRYNLAESVKVKKMEGEYI